MIRNLILFSILLTSSSYSKTINGLEVDQTQLLYRKQHETSFSKINILKGKPLQGNWFSFTAQKNGFLKQVSLYGKPNRLTKGLYGETMAGVIKENTQDNTSTLGEWRISRNEIVDQHKSLMGVSHGWISIKIEGIVPQEVGTKYFFVCNRISEDKKWFGAFYFSDENPYANGEFWLNPNHDLVFATFVASSPSFTINHESAQLLLAPLKPTPQVTR